MTCEVAFIVLCELCSYTLESIMNPFLVKRFHQVVHCMDLECLYTILPIRCAEDDDWHPVIGDFPQYLETIGVWHLNIQQEKVRPEITDSGNRFPRIAAFSYHFDALLGLKQHS